MKTKFKSIGMLSTIACCFALTSCNAGRFYDETYQEMNRLELGVVQKEIQTGMDQADVAVSLGSPNIVTTDKEGKETWIYDKVATEVRQSGTCGFILFCQTGADYVSRKDTSQKTLTVIIKFDNCKRVESVQYHASKF